MNYIFLPEARDELDAHMDYYENIQPGLGRDFHNEIVSALSNIIDHPQMWPKVEGEIRRYLTNEFPFSVFYRYNQPEQQIVIYAIMHNKQHPDYWKGRL